MKDCGDLVSSDDFVLLALTNSQTIGWLVESTEKVGNIHDNPELLKQREG